MHAEIWTTSPRLHTSSHNSRSSITPKYIHKYRPLYTIPLLHPTRSEKTSHAPTIAPRDSSLQGHSTSFVEGNQTGNGASSVTGPEHGSANRSSDPEGCTHCTGNNGTTGEWGFSTSQEPLPAAFRLLIVGCGEGGARRRLTCGNCFI